MALIYADRVKETASNKPNGATAFNLPDTGATGYRSFDSVLASTDTCTYGAENGTAWEVGIGTFTAGSPDTLTRTTILSSSTGSAIDWSAGGDVSVYITAESLALQSAYGQRGFISGGQLAYSSTTVITVSGCRLFLNNKVMSSSGTTTLTSGSTMLDIAGTTVTLGANKCYFVYAYDNAGTLAFRLEERDGTGDGADPTWDADLDYWKSPSTGAAARRIGKFWTNASSQVIGFKAFNRGRYRGMAVYLFNAVPLVNGVTQSTFTDITTTPYLTADDEEMALQISCGNNDTSTECYMYLSIDGGTSEHLKAGLAADTTNVAVPLLVPYTGSLHYKTSTGDNGYVRLFGYGARV